MKETCQSTLVDGRALIYVHARTGVLHPSDERTFSSHIANEQNDSGGNHSLKVFSEVTDVTHKGRSLMVPLHTEDYYQCRFLKDEISI